MGWNRYVNLEGSGTDGERSELEGWRGQGKGELA